MKHAALICLMAYSTALVHSQSLSSRQILVFGDSSFSTYGRLLSVAPDTLKLLTTGGRESIPRDRIRRIIVRSDTPPDGGVRYGILIGAYASLFLLGVEEGSGTFIHRRLSEEPGAILLAFVPGMAVGAGIGYLVDRRSGGSERVYEMIPGDWERLTASLGPPDPGVVHFAVLAAQVYDLSFDDPTFSGYGPQSNASRFNLARKIQCTYSVTPALEIGLALAPTGKLEISRSAFESPGPRESRSYSMERSLALTGYYAVAQYSLFRGGLPPGLELKLGGAIGVTAVEYRRTAQGGIYTYDSTRSTYTTIGPFSHNVSRTDLSGMAFAEVSLRVYDGLTLGLVADRMFVREVTDPGEPAVRSHPTAAILTTWGLGIQLGIHF